MQDAGNRIQDSERRLREVDGASGKAANRQTDMKKQAVFFQRNQIPNTEFP